MTKRHTKGRIKVFHFFRLRGSKECLASSESIIIFSSLFFFSWREKRDPKIKVRRYTQLLLYCMLSIKLWTCSQFHQRSMSSFYARRSQKCKKWQSSCQYFCALRICVEHWWNWPQPQPISPTIYEQLFRWYSFIKKLHCQNVGGKRCRKLFSTKKQNCL